jgi:hypothetical protein
MDLVGTLIFFNLYGLFLGAFLWSISRFITSRFRNRREKIYTNVIFSLKYVVSHIFKSYGKY